MLRAPKLMEKITRSAEERKAAIRERIESQRYQIVIIDYAGRVYLRGADTAPPEATIIKWAVNLKAAFVTRYYPSKKGWLIIDVRRARFSQHPGASFGTWLDVVRSQTPLPSREAATMIAIHKLTGHSSTA